MSSLIQIRGSAATAFTRSTLAPQTARSRLNSSPVSLRERRPMSYAYMHYSCTRRQYAQTIRTLGGLSWARHTKNLADDLHL